MKNCTVFIGNAHFESPKEVRVGNDLLTATEIFLNVGGRAITPDFPGVDSIPWMNNVGILELETLPRHLVVVGGSYIGLEFAQIFRRFGSEVTVIEKYPAPGLSRRRRRLRFHQILPRKGRHHRTPQRRVHSTSNLAATISQ